MRTSHFTDATPYQPGTTAAQRRAVARRQGLAGHVPHQQACRGRAPSARGSSARTARPRRGPGRGRPSRPVQPTSHASPATPASARIAGERRVPLHSEWPSAPTSTPAPRTPGSKLRAAVAGALSVTCSVALGSRRRVRQVELQRPVRPRRRRADRLRPPGSSTGDGPWLRSKCEAAGVGCPTTGPAMGVGDATWCSVEWVGRGRARHVPQWYYASGGGLPPSGQRHHPDARATRARPGPARRRSCIALRHQHGGSTVAS
jgi:hypothetical protein